MSGRERRRIRERGSALLIVFVFAAIIAIMLYREMPVAAFEAQRQKEELLVDRGNEYKHAVKLFVRKLGTYPASLEALENTNRMRFLRHRFVDPFTGKDDWRLLHAGPGGVIVDSKVNPNPTKPNGLNGAPGTNNGSSASAFNNGSTFNSGSSFGSGGTVPGNNTSSNSTSSNSRTSSSASSGGFAGFANSFSGGSSNGTANSGDVTVPAIAQRRPAIAVSGGGSAGSGSGNNEENAQPDALSVPVPTDGQPLPAQALPAQAQAAGEANPPAGLVNATTASASPNSNDPQAVLRSLLNNGQNPVAQQNTAAAPNPTPNTIGAQNPTAAAQTGSPFGRTTNTSAFGNNLASGGIAGVASKAKGHTIKLINDQSDYSLWEFYFDLAKEANAGLANAIQGKGNTSGVANGANAQRNGSSSGFSLSNGQSSGFGSPSGFGSSPNTTNTSPAIPTGPNPVGTSSPPPVGPPQP